jgi:hypothetical protein
MASRVKDSEKDSFLGKYEERFYNIIYFPRIVYGALSLGLRGYL